MLRQPPPRPPNRDSSSDEEDFSFAEWIAREIVVAQDNNNKKYPSRDDHAASAESNSKKKRSSNSNSKKNNNSNSKEKNSSKRSSRNENDNETTTTGLHSVVTTKTTNATKKNIKASGELFKEQEDNSAEWIMEEIQNRYHHQATRRSRVVDDSASRQPSQRPSPLGRYAEQDRPPSGLKTKRPTRFPAQEVDETTTTASTDQDGRRRPGAFRILGMEATAGREDDDDEQRNDNNDDEGSNINANNDNTDDLPVLHATPVHDDTELVLAEKLQLESAQQRRRRTVRLLFTGACASAIVVALALGLGLGLTSRNSNDPIVTTAPTSAPTMAPTLSVPGVVSFLESQTIGDEPLQIIDLPSSLGDLTQAGDNNLSPQVKAVDYLVGLQTSGVRLPASLETIQRYVMAVMYFSLDGQDWTNQDLWLTAEDPCTWYSSTSPESVCNDQGAIVELNLNRNQLRGIIPRELALLSTNLRVLDLSLNALTGTLPTELSFLINLDTLWFSGNLLTGTIPAQYGSMPTLGKAYFDFSSLTGTVPSELCNRTLSDNNTTTAALSLLWADCDEELRCDCCTRCCNDASPCFLDKKQSN